jgi:hypothetical protein
MMMRRQVPLIVMLLSAAHASTHAIRDVVHAVRSRDL